MKISEMIRAAADNPVVYLKKGPDFEIRVIRKQGPGIPIYICELDVDNRTLQSKKPAQWTKEQDAVKHAQQWVRILTRRDDWIGLDFTHQWKVKP